MKPFQRRVLVVAVDGDMTDAPVLEKLDEVDGEGALADAAFAVDDEVETFVHAGFGLSIRTWPIRGPRGRETKVCAPLGSFVVSVSADGGSDEGGGEWPPQGQFTLNALQF